MATARQRMAREKDDARYEALGKTFDEMRAEREAVCRRIDELATRPAADTAAVTPQEKVERLMIAPDELAAVTAHEAARERIRPLVLRLGIWVGLDFEAGMLGKREVRRLRRGVIAFGQEQLPARIHGARGVDPGDGLPDAKPPVRQIAPPIRRQNLTAAQAAEAGQGRLHQDHETQRAPACCRGPAVDFGASGGDGTGDFRTDEPNSGMEQSRTRSNVGATPDVTSWTTRQCSGMSAEIAGLCPYPFPHQIWFEGDAVRVRTVRGLYRRGR